jgi:hypothetical protein
LNHDSCNTNEDSCCGSKCAGRAAYFFGILGALLLMAALVAAMIRYTTPPPLGADRGAERMKNLVELNSANAQLLNAVDWQDKPKQLVRLPIAAAMELTVKEWQNPAAARAKLIERADKLAAPPPKAPEVKSAFE